ncbi:MAG: DoxX family membrane protein [Ignavibacteriaceae bacterium]|nr:DoxX family membrane protein [Ignavibacteriaceae bacterium]
MKKIISNEYFLLTSRIVLAFVFIFSGIEKINDLQNFSYAITNYKLLPVSIVNVFAISLPWIELIAGVLLLFGISVKENAAIINVLLILFIAAIGISVLRGLNIDCGCFGTAGGQKVGFTKIGENTLLLLLGLQLMFWDSKKLIIRN